MHKTTTFPNLIGLERGLVVHLDIGIHVADVAVADQVHVSYVSYLFLTLTTWPKQASRLHLASHASNIFKESESEQIFTIVISISSKLVSDCL
jgi:hypothetical protein